LHDILRQLARRPFPDGRHRDETGEVRLVVRTPSWDDYVELATEELTLAGAESPPVVRRLRRALEDLREIAPPERCEIIEQRLELLTRLGQSAHATGSQDGDVLVRER